MAYNEQLVDDMRELMLEFGDDITEKKMFGGLCFLYKGKMTVGIMKDMLVTRVLSPQYEKLLEEDFCTEMDFTGRVMKEFIYVEEEGFRSKKQKIDWIKLGIEHAKHKLGE